MVRADLRPDSVSVIVLNYNRALTTLECLDALSRAASALVSEVIVVDNGSDDDQLDVLRQRHRLGGFTLLEVGDNRFFGEGNNIGADAARTDDVLFLNNDAFVEPGCIEELAASLHGSPGVAAVGPMFLYPDGRVQEVGGVILPTGDVVQVGKGTVWGPDHFDTPCPVDYCSAACLLMRRADFLDVGGFGLEWEPAYYEDADLCLKLLTRCGQVMVNPRARVVHLESTTTSDATLHLHDISEINRARFVEKWGPWLRARQAARLPDVEPPASVTATTPKPGRTATDGTFVVFSPYPLVPGGGERVLFELASHFADLVGTANVVFATKDRYSTSRMRQLESTFGLDHVVGATVPLSELDTGDVRLSVVIGNDILPSVPSIGDRCVYLVQFPFWVSDRVVETRRPWMSGYDEIWVYSEFVRRHVNGLLRHYELDAPPVRLVSASATWPGADAGLPWPQRRTILNVGRFFAGGHNKRQDVVIEAFRRVVELGATDVELALAGAIHPSPEGRRRFHELQGLAEGLDCAFYPNIGRADLARLYARSAVLVHAAGYGVDPDEFPERLEHFGITPVEAASFGCIPVVYGQGGPLDVLRELGCDTAFDTVDDCARIVTSLLDDPAGSSDLSRAIRQSSQIYSAEAYVERIDVALRDLGVL